ncbi:MAG: hypothetical protein AAF318_06930 [Pseudomonadota bacterium]
MRAFVCVCVCACVVALCGPAAAQNGSIAAPVAHASNYDPTMSAKEAVLANWELAAAGIRAGKVVGRKVAATAAKGGSYRALVRQAKFAQKTMVQRYNAAQWVYTPRSGVAGAADGAALTRAVAAANAVCTADCAAERAAILTAFQDATTELDQAASAARVALEARVERADTVLMSEQLSLMADYLEEGAWARDFNLTAHGRDGEEVAARIVGTLSLWRNIEPYVGLRNAEIDGAINAAAEQLLRTLRRTTRQRGALDPSGPELAAITAKARQLAAEIRRAAALFTS